MNKFKDFLLESISPVETNFGIDKDFSNEEWITHLDRGISMSSTFFEGSEYLYLVSFMGDGEIGFKTAEKQKIDYSKIKSIEYLKTTFTTNAVKTENSFRIFGKVMYVILKYVEECGEDEIRFRPDKNNPGLSSLYAKLINNKYFIDYIKKIGFEYMGPVGTGYKFMRRN